LDLDEAQRNSASHLDASCLTLRQHLTNFEGHYSTLKIEADEKFGSRQFIQRAKLINNVPNAVSSSHQNGCGKTL